jgi:hypothetical protein
MQTLLLLRPQSGKSETSLQSDRDIKTPGPFAGTILAGRYKIYNTTDLVSFKAHDLALDQTVSVRVALLTSKSCHDIWREKAQQLALVRNPNFLNVLDVVSEKSRDFVISEHPRGKSVAELLRERSRFDVEDVLALMTPLAGALDLTASFACSPNLNPARCLFTESKRWVEVNSAELSLSEFPRLLVRMDVWELVKPRKNIASSCLISKVRKRRLKRLAVRQAALLTYELLGGGTHSGTEVKRWFKPINQLSKATNSILYDGLQGSPRFKNSESFFHTLESAIRSYPRKSKERYDPALEIREHSMAYPGPNDVLRRFNRDSRCLAAGVLGVVVFTALAFAALVPERYSKTAGLPKQTSQAKSGYLLNADFATLFSGGNSSAKNSTSQVTSGPAASVDQGFAEYSSDENLARMEAVAAPTPNPALMLSPAMNRVLAQANGSKVFPAHRPDFARVIRTRIPQERYRSSAHLRDVDVKIRLIALWHHSLVPSQKSRGWTLFSNSNKWHREKISYTAATSH